MSQRNGDRARADKKRKAKIQERTRIREFRKAIQLQSSKKATE